MAQEWVFRQPPEPVQGPRYIAPLTLTYGSQPPLRAALLLTAMQCIRAWDAPDPMPLQKAVAIVPLTLVYGQQPPRRYPQPHLIGQMWEVTWPAQRPAQIVPLTLLYGNQPPRVYPQPHIIRQAWEVTWPAQTEAPNAAWNVAPATYVPYVRTWVPMVLQSWQPETLPQRAPVRQIVSVDNPPPFRSGLGAILMWHQAAPVSAFGKVPVAAVLPPVKTSVPLRMLMGVGL